MSDTAATALSKALLKSARPMQIVETHQTLRAQRKSGATERIASFTKVSPIGIVPSIDIPVHYITEEDLEATQESPTDCNVDLEGEEPTQWLVLSLEKESLVESQNNDDSCIDSVDDVVFHDGSTPQPPISVSECPHPPPFCKVCWQYCVKARARGDRNPRACQTCHHYQQMHKIKPVGRPSQPEVHACPEGLKCKKKSAIESCPTRYIGAKGGHLKPKKALGRPRKNKEKVLQPATLDHEVIEEENAAPATTQPTTTTTTTSTTATTSIAPIVVSSPVSVTNVAAANPTKTPEKPKKQQPVEPNPKVGTKRSKGSSSVDTNPQPQKKQKTSSSHPLSAASLSRLTLPIETGLSYYALQGEAHALQLTIERIFTSKAKLETALVLARAKLEKTQKAHKKAMRNEAKEGV